MCLSHAALLDGLINLVNMSDVMLCSVSLAWISAINTVLRGTLFGATRIITTERYSPELVCRLIEKYKVTVLISKPEFIMKTIECAILEKNDLSSLRFVRIGGSGLPLHLKSVISSYIPNGKIYVNYGMSECTPIACDVPASKDRDTVGTLYKGICAKIVDENGNRCGANVDGEICIKMSFKFLGYVDQKDTEKVFDSEGFLLTGDVGHFDEDGYLKIVDRKNDIFKYDGCHVYPSEIESYLYQIPFIKSVCVVHVPYEAVYVPAALIIRADVSTICEKDVLDLVAGNLY